MKDVLNSFEHLVRRSIAPSVTFFVLAGAADLALWKLGGHSGFYRLELWMDALRPALRHGEAVVALFAFLAVLGVSYALATLQQVLFDNRLKGDFAPAKVPVSPTAPSEGRQLRELRKRVVERLGSLHALRRLWGLERGGGEQGDRPSDYLLYEILGGIDPTDTRGFVDSAKSLGIVFAAAILALWIPGAIHRDEVAGQLGLPVSLWLLCLLTGGAVLYLLGREAVKTQYRARALRLYVNFLMMPEWRILRIVEGREPGGAWPKAGGRMKEADEESGEDGP